MKLPQAFCEMLGDRPFEEDHWGKSGSKIRLFDGLVLKAEPQGEETEQAVAMMRYLEGKLPVPRVIRHETVGGISYLLMTRMKGRMLCDEFYMKRPGFARTASRAGASHALEYRHKRLPGAKRA